LYPDLYQGLGLTQAYLAKYVAPLVAFDGTMVTPARQIQLPMEIGGRKQYVDFIVVHSYSPCTTILSSP